MQQRKATTQLAEPLFLFSGVPVLKTGRDYLDSICCGCTQFCQIYADVAFKVLPSIQFPILNSLNILSLHLIYPELQTASLNKQ